MRNILLLPLLFLSLSCQAHNESDRRLVSTNGYGEITVPADTVILDLSVRATRKSGQEAKRDVDDRVNAFIDRLEALSISQDDLVASSIRIHPRYEHTDNNRLFSGYEAMRQLTVTLKDMTQLTEVMDQALAQRVEGIDNVRYENSQMAEHIQAAYLLAIADSKSKAEALAKAYGAELGSVVRIDYHRNTPPPGDMMKASGMETMMVRNSAPRPGTYLPDEITFSDNIQVVFDLIISR
ncbi:SIMPL domain-containing protein [Porticoccus sp.]|uniref:SIMPL domain-containing protein n=1 Tax=Porticoccus sp. TaxID=2024853 RepID=UPI003F6959A7